MKRNLTIALATIMASTVAAANTTVTVDEMSNQAPKTTIVVEKAASQEVQLPKETIAPTKVEPAKTEVVDKELAEINPDVKPEPVPNIFDAPKAEEKKEVKAEPKKPELTASTEDSLDLNPAATEVELPVKEAKKSKAHKVHAPVYEEVAYEKPMSPSEQIRAYRQKMEERNVLQLQKKIEEIRIKQELALARKLQESMNQTIKALDNI